MKKMIVPVLLFLALGGCTKDTDTLPPATVKPAAVYPKVSPKEYCSVTITRISVVDTVFKGANCMTLSTYPEDSLIYRGDIGKTWDWNLTYTITDFKKTYNVSIHDNVGHKRGISFQMCYPAAMGDFPNSYTFKDTFRSLYITIYMTWNEIKY